jgi:hypothetical protein
MKRIVIVGTVIGLILALSGVAMAAEKAPQEIIDLANTKLADIGKDSLIIDAVKAQNAKRMSLDSIKQTDERWKSTAGIADFMTDLMESKCGLHLRSMQDSNPSYVEIFVMDNQGANVCQSDKTSDYWQGDEAKFKNSYNGGKGAVFVDDVEFDDSTQAYITQVSVPVIDGEKVIGAITFGIDIDKL